MTNDPLLDALRELARALAPADIRLIVGGGYGLVLRARQLIESGARTLRLSIPPIRATEDIDCFLTTEIIIDRTRMASIRAVLDSLGYQPTVKNLQFTRRVDHEGQSRAIKIDLLAGPVPSDVCELVHIKDMRIRPRGTSGLHAYLTREAISIERGLQQLNIAAGGDPVIVALPHPFTYLLLKLFALRDRLNRGDVAAQKYHALDLFATWSMLTEPEWEEAQQFGREYQGDMIMTEASRVVAELFAGDTSPGVIALLGQALLQGMRIERDVVYAFRHDLALVFATGR